MSLQQDPAFWRFSKILPHMVFAPGNQRTEHLATRWYSNTLYPWGNAPLYYPDERGSYHGSSHRSFYWAWPNFNEGIRSYKEAIVRCLLRLLLHPGCLASSSTWFQDRSQILYSVPDSVTKYFTPLLAPSVSRNSKLQFKSTEFLIGDYVTTMGRLAPPEGRTAARHLWSPPFSGKEVLYAPLHPLVVLPSKVIHTGLFFGFAEVIRKKVHHIDRIRECRFQVCGPDPVVAPHDLFSRHISFWMECTCNAMNPFGVRSSISKAVGIPFTQVRIWEPMHSIRYLFHCPFVNAFFRDHWTPCVKPESSASS